MRFDISVVIPTFNRRHVLDRALDSVLAQTTTAHEIIVVDNGSDDGTIDWLEQKYPQINCLQQPDRGVSAARNLGILAATGNWIALLDSDDQWLPEKLQRQMGLLQSSPDFRICHSDEIWIRNGKRVNAMKKHQKPDNWIYQDCLPLCCVSPSSILIHRSVLDDIGLFDESLPACEDYDLWLRMFASYPIKLLPEPLLKKYGGHEDQLSRKYWGMDRFRVRSLDKMLHSDSLDRQQRAQTLAMLNSKLDILIQGSLKRARQSDVDAFTAMKQRWSTR